MRMSAWNVRTECAALSVWLLSVIVLGCGSPDGYYADRRTKSKATSVTSDDTPAATASKADFSGKKPSVKLAPDEAPSGEAIEDTRKIIYTGGVDLVVDSFLEVETSLPKLIRQYHGQLAGSDRRRTSGEQLSGHWVVRVPVREFDRFLDAVCRLGVPESRQINAQDVSEEYIDLEARLKNKQRLEERMLKLLEERTGELKDVLAVEAELSRVREGIEQIEGRLRFLNDRLALTTLTINVREEKDYVPPEAPTLNQQIASTFGNSLHSLTTLGVNLLLAGVALAPWAPLGLVVALPIWYVRRKARRR